MLGSHLPEGEEDHQLNHRELEHGVEGCQQLVRAHVEQQQRVQGHRVRQVVHDGDPQVPAGQPWSQPSLLGAADAQD